MVKYIIRKLIYRHRASSEDYIRWLKKKGVRIGNGTSFINPKNTEIDVTRPWLISIGRSCCITAGVTILSHDYGWSVLKAVYGDVIGSAGKTEIGDHVYIGTHTTIVAGVKVGNNVVIGANSLVSRNLPDNVVAAGNPARVIRTLDEYYEKRRRSELAEATEMVKEYYKVYNRVLPLEIMREHFWLFENNKECLIEEFKKVMKLVEGSEELSWRKFKEHEKVFESYEDFLLHCGIAKQN